MDIIIDQLEQTVIIKLKWTKEDFLNLEGWLEEQEPEIEEEASGFGWDLMKKIWTKLNGQFR